MFKTTTTVDLNNSIKIVDFILFGIVIRRKVTSIPKLGSHIRITCLPVWRNPYNGRTAVNAHIGSEGCVDRVCADGSFDLRLTSGAILLVGPKYCFENI